MDLFTSLENRTQNPLKCIDMHTTGGPVRILFKGFPTLKGKSLDEIQSLARTDFDYIRRRLMQEPRGHREMFGAIPITHTELTETPSAKGGAHLGVLFMHHEGYTTMCGHATFALSRFMVDTHDKEVFPRREELEYDPDTLTTEVRIHAPCGILKVKVPVLPGGKQSDPNRDTTILSVPSFCNAYNLPMKIPENKRWPELNGDHVMIDVIYGGMYFIHVTAQELGFSKGLRSFSIDDLAVVGKSLKETIHADPEILIHFESPTSKKVPETFGILVRDEHLGQKLNDVLGAETAVNLFGSESIDRSPCGSGTAARSALAYLKGERALGERWGYHSILSAANGGIGLFVGTIVKEVEIPGGKGPGAKGVVVAIEGRSFYVNLATFVAEETDVIAEQGFVVEKLPAILEAM